MLKKKSSNGIATKSKDINKNKNTATMNTPQQPIVTARKKFFACPICKDKLFEKAQALGGHMSKSHPH